MTSPPMATFDRPVRPLQGVGARRRPHLHGKNRTVAPDVKVILTPPCIFH
jgi:hypothetical protein